MTAFASIPRTRRERLRMAGFLFVLVCGFACTYLLMEPFPSPILPGFARVPDERDTVAMEIPLIIVISANNTTDTLSAQELFAETRNVNAIELLRTTFYHERESPVIARAEGHGLYHTLKELRRSMRTWFATAVPSAQRSFRRNGSIDASSRAWLFARVHAIRPHTTAQRIRVEWFETEASMPFDVVEVSAP